MYRIAICDDEAVQCRLTRSLVEDYLSLHDLTAKIAAFTTSQDLVNAVYEAPFDLYLLDIVMPKINGIALGTEIRKTDPDGMIIYTTTSPDFALESYGVKAFSYLLKPLKNEQFFPVLDDALNACIKRRERCIMIKTQTTQARIPLDNILYVELKTRAAHYYLKDGNCLTGSTLKTSFQEAMQPLLENKNFFLCGASYVLNLHHIQSVTKTHVQFPGELSVPIPKRVYTALHTAWANYWLEAGY